MTINREREWRLRCDVVLLDNWSKTFVQPCSNSFEKEKKWQRRQCRLDLAWKTGKSKKPHEASVSRRPKGEENTQREAETTGAETAEELNHSRWFIMHHRRRSVRREDCFSFPIDRLFRGNVSAWKLPSRLQTFLFGLFSVSDKKKRR